MPSPYTLQFERLTNANGSEAEQHLIQHWKAEIDAFLEPSHHLLLNGSIGLQIGIEDTLALKINLTYRKWYGAIPTLLELMKINPTLEAWGRYTLQHSLRFHCGIKLTPDRLTHELYTYPKDFNELQALLGDGAFEEAVRTLKPSGGIGIDDHRGYSYYFTPTNADWIETLLSELGLKHWQGDFLPLQQVRLDGKNLVAGKAGMDITPLTPEVLTRIINHYPFPYFRYLIPMRRYRGGTFGRDPVSGRFALYALVC